MTTLNLSLVPHWELKYNIPAEHQSGKLFESWSSTFKTLFYIENSDLFWQVFLNFKPFSKFPMSTNLVFFKSSIDPEWSHAKNKEGGKWEIRGKNNSRFPDLYDKVFFLLSILLVSNELENTKEYNGVIYCKKKFPRVELWTRGTDRETMENCRYDIYEKMRKHKELVKLSEEELNMFSLEFLPHGDSVSTEKDGKRKEGGDKFGKGRKVGGKNESKWG